MAREPGALVVGRYQLARLIGKGGMGEVFEAVDVQTRRRVAIKWVRLGEESSAELLARFQREVRVTSTLTSRHIIGIHDAGRDEHSGDAFMVMDLLEGEDVAALAARLGPLSIDLAVRIVAQACEGLAVAHAAGVIHRDIKPGNLFLARTRRVQQVDSPRPSGSAAAADRADPAAIAAGYDSGALRTIKIVDFGIARVRAIPEVDPTDLTRTGALVGSPAYMAPEQIRGLRTLDHRADVWALGIVLYRLLAGVVPHERHEGSLAGLVFAICGEPAPPLSERAPWVPQALCDVIHHALEISADARLPSARAFADELRPWLSEGLAIDEAMLVPRAAAADPSARAGSIADGPTLPRVPSSPRVAPEATLPDPFAPPPASGAVLVVEDDRRSARRVRKSREVLAQAKLAEQAAAHYARRDARAAPPRALTALTALDTRTRAIVLLCGLGVSALLAQVAGRYMWGLAPILIAVIVGTAFMAKPVR